MVENQRLLESDVCIARCLGELFNPVFYPGVKPRHSNSQEKIGCLADASSQRIDRAPHALEGSLIAAGRIRWNHCPPYN